jgi:hypothetical protein
MVRLDGTNKTGNSVTKSTWKFLRPLEDLLQKKSKKKILHLHYS